MRQVLLMVHLLGLAAFLGSVFGHILFGWLIDPMVDPAGYAVLQDAKHVSTACLTMPGFLVAILSGAGLLLTRCAGIGTVRLRAKLVLVVLIGANAAFVLMPLGAALANLAAAGAPAGTLAALAGRESAFGAANLVMVLAVIALSVHRPGGAASHPPRTGEPRHAV